MIGGRLTREAFDRGAFGLDSGRAQSSLYDDDNFHCHNKICHHHHHICRAPEHKHLSTELQNVKSLAKKKRFEQNKTPIGNYTQSNDTTFNDLDCLLTWISRSRYILTLNISEMTRDRAIVTINHQLEVIGSLLNGDIFNDLDGPLIQFSRSRHF